MSAVSPLPQDGVYTSRQVVRMTGITYRQLDYWIRSGYLELAEPFPGSGIPRSFTTADVARVQEIHLTLQRVRQMLLDARMGMPQWLRGQFPEEHP